MASGPNDEFGRKIYGLLGMPLDADTMPEVMRKIEIAAGASTPLLVSTANLNFLIASQSDDEFRRTLVSSDLCTADGMPVVWLARLLGIPVKERVAGSDLFEALKSRRVAAPLKVFLFGGPEGVAAAAAVKLNAENAGLVCTGSYYPGFGSIEDMSSDAIIAAINASRTDFLAVALGARKGQIWLLRNHMRLTVPVSAHLGATVNFQAGTARRAPRALQRLGFEWLCRIKEEPQLWQRYWRDGLGLLRLILTRVLPLFALNAWHGLRRKADVTFQTSMSTDHNSVTVALSGAATAAHASDIIPRFREALAAGKDVVINFSKVSRVDSRFLGLLLVLEKRLGQSGHRLILAELPRRIGQMVRLHGFEFLVHR